MQQLSVPRGGGHDTISTATTASADDSSFSASPVVQDSGSLQVPELTVPTNGGAPFVDDDTDVGDTTGDDGSDVVGECNDESTSWSFNIPQNNDF